MPVDITHRVGEAIDFNLRGSHAGGTYRFDSHLPKPCFHPLRTATGHVLTGFQMSDHPWHRGLWFTIKFINGVNFWEEPVAPPHAAGPEEFGVQRSAKEPEIIPDTSDALVINHSLLWHCPSQGDVISEARRLRISFDPHATMTIEWQTRLHALHDLLLDRSPYTTWGGYGGFTFRGGRTLHNTSVLFPDGARETILIAKPAPWIVLQGALDGAPGLNASVALLSHPDNPRSPATWYGKATPEYVFLNAAFLFHQPMALPRGETLQFHYRCLIRDGTWQPLEIETLARAMACTP